MDPGTLVRPLRLHLVYVRLSSGPHTNGSPRREHLIVNLKLAINAPFVQLRTNCCSRRTIVDVNFIFTLFETAR